MSLVPGVRLGPYEIVSAIGAGGMGEVYRARDTRLERDVAVKVLPSAFANDPERLARFEREAKTLASLNHPGIATIYGVEDGAGIQALVMELVDGETLAERIARGALPVDEALRIARQIAEALEAAHEHGIIHRDLKPANIKIRSDETVKVLDFGLAKAIEPSGGVSSTFSLSPTITTPAMTALGVLLGTAAYMAPEQAKGRGADKRSDIWAFGCVLYEMLTGKGGFEGEDASDTLAAVLRGEPDWAALPQGLPAAVRELLRGCLEKDRRRRVADASAVLFVMAHADRFVDRVEVIVPGPPDAASIKPHVDAAVLAISRNAKASMHRRVAVAGALMLAFGGALSGTIVWYLTRPAPPRVERFRITPDASAPLSINGTDRDLAITPDGNRVIYVLSGSRLVVKSVDQLDPTVLFTSGGLRAPFVSPDGQWVGFIENNNVIRKIAITGGPPLTVAQPDGTSRGATWLPDDTIIFASSNPATGLQRVASVGGSVTTLTRPDRTHGEDDHLWPQALPGGRAVLFTVSPISGGLDAAQVVLLDLQTGKQRTLIRGGSDAHYLSSGHLVYASGGTLRAVAFDLNRLETSGTPVPVLSRLVTTAVGAADFSVAGDGTLVYADAPGATTLAARTLVWVNRQGREEPLGAPARPYIYPRLSPDGTRVAIFSSDQQSDIWVWDLAHQTLTRLTFDPGIDQTPVWSPDGKHVLFSSARAGATNLFWVPSDGAGAAERLIESPNQQYPTAVSPDGNTIVLYENDPATQADIYQLTLNGTRKVQPLLRTPFTERGGIISPDDRWIAYESNSSGGFEIYVRPFPNVGEGQWQISTGGGTRPLWARSGQELFYIAPDGALMSVRVDRGPTWTAGTPAKILDGVYFTGADTGNFSRSYDVSGDGQRFLMLKRMGGDPSAPLPHIVVIRNWFEELKRLVPAR